MKIQLCLLLSLSSVANIVSAQAAELVKNGGFEEGGPGKADHWPVPAGTYRVEDGAGMNGNRGLVFENRDPMRQGNFVSQSIPAKPGIAYRFSAMIKTEDICGQAKDGVPGCATLLVTAYGENNRYLGEYTSERLRGTREWTKVAGKTPRLPADVVRLTVTPFGWHRATGKAYFDEISLEPIEEKPVAGVYSSAYRDVAWSGEVRFLASLAIDTSVNPLDSLKAEFAFPGDGYATERVAASEFLATEASITLPVAKLPLGKYPVSFELRRKADGKLVDSADLMFERTSAKPERKVYFDCHNRLIVDGKPFFPLGSFVYNVDEKVLDIYAKSRFNVILPYMYLPLERFDAMQRRGLKIIGSLKDFMPGARYAPVKNLETEGDADRALLHRFNEVKNHPALVCWYMNDESSVSHIPRLERQYGFVRAFDPDHPCYAVLFQYDQIRMYAGTCDVIGTDPYPVPSKPIGDAAVYARAAVKGFVGRPYWQVPQAFDWAWFMKDKKAETGYGRYPTKEELRSMTYQAIANGANGIIYYCLGTMLANLRGEAFDKAWRELCELSEEVENDIHVFLSDPAANATGYPEGVSGRAWSEGGRSRLLVVNETREMKKADIDFDGRRLRLELAPLAVWRSWK